jgi:hypothetical protein
MFGWVGWCSVIAEPGEYQVELFPCETSHEQSVAPTAKPFTYCRSTQLGVTSNLCDGKHREIEHTRSNSVSVTAIFGGNS